MSSDEVPRPQTSSNRAFLGGAWTITSITTISLLARLYIRYHRFKRLCWDDFFVIFGWALSVPLAAQVTVSTLETTSEHGGHSAIFTNRVMTQALFYTCLWSIKISFLIFFKRIGSTKLRGSKIYWRVVLGFTILSYGAVWATDPYGCFIEKGVDACATDPEVNKFLPTAFSIACTLDIVSDVLIMVIPFTILYHLRLSPRQKLILYALFSLVFVTISVAIVRVVISSRNMRQTLNVTWLLFLTHIEANTSIIVACIGSVRFLFTQDQNSSKQSVRRAWIASSHQRRLGPESNTYIDLDRTEAAAETPFQKDDHVEVGIPKAHLSRAHLEDLDTGTTWTRPHFPQETLT
ncbi:hypothetical protein K491DRAFT_709738 [Lophiostoma macrostomum CBS 122681]|uniref:Rhodopsin domain-containing protein n=1 Tax=Lophiostoma macrostomum CBS 122681 TaxID=1314788 RepID=A0A6A6TT64_9PLEO|nr:hypothetical protein K491DRAFT_709738 [Lophiostoma macrostomum CBS 122681]